MRSHPSQRERISHACDRCRHMRTKCSGGTRCAKCIKDDANCVYGDRKRERNKKDLSESLDRVTSLEEENQNLLSALRTVTSDPEFPAEKFGDVMKTLAKYSSNRRNHLFSPASGSRETEDENLMEFTYKDGNNPQSLQSPSTVGGEKSAASSIGSPGRQGELTRVVDLDSGSGAAGFVGKMSDVSWIQRVRDYLEAEEVPARGLDQTLALFDRHTQSAKEATYFMDEDNLLSIDEDLVNGQQWPPFQVSLILAEAYFHSVQGAFHFLIKEEFMKSLLRFPYGKPMLTWAERSWLGIANLVWAIGSKWLQMTQLDSQNSLDSHLIYYARARALGLDHRILFDHPDVERIQAIGLLSFYLLVNGSISRAWNTLGHAIRHASSLGLHLRVTDPSMSEVEQERRAKTWYSLLSLEILIAEITGRPKSISIAEITVPISLLQYSETDNNDKESTPDSVAAAVAESKQLWITFLNSRKSSLRDAPPSLSSPSNTSIAPDQALSFKHLACHIQLCSISDLIATQLYTGVQDQPWFETQRKMAQFQTQLRYWVESLPEELDVQSKPDAYHDSKAKVELSLYYYSVQMILYRQCLCDFQTDKQSATSTEFNNRAARGCVHASMSLLAVMPDAITANEAYVLLPWWTLLHYICQATAVLLLELCLNCQHFENQPAEVVRYLKKALRYLRHLSVGSLSAYRAWRIFRRLLSMLEAKHDNLGVEDIPMEAPKPLLWTEEAEKSLMDVIS